MKNKPRVALFALFALFIINCFFACSTKTVVQEVRNPLIQFAYDSLVWTDNSYAFLATTRIVSYPADPTQPGRLYNRFTMQAMGTDTKGHTLQMIMAFDASDSTQLVGTYRPDHTSARGLAQVQLFNLDNGSLSSYQLCADDSSSFLQIQRQSVTENLISANFQFSLCNARDTTQKILLTNGILTDIHY
jgi:hypothetical protein